MKQQQQIAQQSQIINIFFIVDLQSSILAVSIYYKPSYTLIIAYAKLIFFFQNIKIFMQVGITSSQRVDQSFGNSLISVKKGFKIHVFLHAIQCIAMIAMVPIDIYILKHQNEEVLSFFIIAVCITFLNLAAKLGHLTCKLNDRNNVISIAAELNHVVDQQQSLSERLGNEPNENNNLVSQKIYNVQTNMTVAEANDGIRRTTQSPLANMIRTIALSHDPLSSCIIRLGSLISFGLFIYGIVILASVQQLSTSEIVVMSTFLVSEFLIQIQLFLCLIFVALLPLLCLIICFYACFCKEGNKQAKLPQPVPATVQIIQNIEGSPCSICFQDILLNDQVLILPCSDKHTFHQSCLTTWTAVKSTCPICRHDLSQ